MSKFQDNRENRDEAIETVGLPSGGRYNIFVAAAVNETKIGGTPGYAQVFATLALAEATFLASE